MKRKIKTKGFSAQEFVDQLLNEGSTVSCDETNSYFHINDNLPPFYDEELYKQGQAFFHKHVFAMFGNKFFGLLAILSIPTILKILIHTRQSGSDYTAYKRYVATILHMMIWYDKDFKPGSKLWKSIIEIRRMHNSASKNSCSAGLHRISQKDMALTQFGFMGLSVTRGEKTGIIGATEDEWEAFIHVWRVVGYLLGIEERFNLCGGTVEETREICELLMEQVFKPKIEEKNKDFLIMCKYLIGGMWTLSPIIQYESAMCLLQNVVQNKQSSVYINGGTPTYFKLNFWQTINYHILLFQVYLLNFTWYRIYINHVYYMVLWLVKHFPILAYFRFGVANAYVKLKI